MSIALALAFLASTFAFIAAPASAQHYGPSCGRHSHWVPAHRDRAGHWVRGHCRHD
jgi:Spy/CpxP family protein refolding chaperone